MGEELLEEYSIQVHTETLGETTQKLVVAIGGTPGTGKSTIGASIARLMGMELIELSNLVLEKKLYISYDEERYSFVVDEAGLRRYLRELIQEKKKVLVIGHYSEIVDDDLLDKIIILRLDPRELVKRLVERGWPLEKIIENVESELIGVCTSNALAEHPQGKVCEVDVSGKNIDEVVNEVLTIILSSKPCRVYVDWLSNEEIVNYVLRLSQGALFSYQYIE